MPRIYTSNDDALDFCMKCYPKTEKEAKELYGNLGNGKDDTNYFKYNGCHLSYYDGWEYTTRCYKCDCQLVDDDDGYLD